jgi:hypothetical protein
MGDAIEDMKALQDLQKAVRAEQRADAPMVLTAAGIQFTSANDGAHLMVRYRDKERMVTVVDYWPGTGLWIPRKASGSASRNRGLQKLINYIERNKS